MGKLRTSAAYYRRGISNTNREFAFAVQGNYPVVQPNILYRNSILYPHPPVPPQPNETVPSPPLNVVAVSSRGQALVTWSPPLKDGGSMILSYTVTSSPGDIKATVSSKTNETFVSGLTYGVSYTFTVTATNAKGTSAPSRASNSVVLSPYQQGSPWPHRGGLLNDNSRDVSYSSVYNGSTEIFNTNNINQPFITTPVIDASGTVFVSTYDTVYVINSQPGQLSNSFPLNGNIFSMSAAAIARDGTAYVAGNYQLFAITPDRNTITPILPDFFGKYFLIYGSSPVISNDVLYIGGKGGLAVVQLTNNPENAYLIWSSFNEDYLDYGYTPAIGGDGTIYQMHYIPSSDISHNDYTILIAYNSNIENENNNIKWISEPFLFKNQMSIPNAFFASSPVIGSNGSIYVLFQSFFLTDISFCVFDPCNNPVNTIFDGIPYNPSRSYTDISNTIVTSPALGQDGRVYISTSIGGLYALDADGRFLAKYTDISCQSVPCVGRHPSSGKDIVYVNDYNGDIVVALQYNTDPPSFSRLLLTLPVDVSSQVFLDQGFSLDAYGNLYVPIGIGSNSEGGSVNPNLYICRLSD